jgi:biotin transporter BioY
MNDERLELDRQKLTLDQEKFAFEQAKHLRERWVQEEAGISQKVSWLITTQAFFGAGYVYLKQQAASDQSLSKMFIALPAFAATICIAVFISVRASHAIQDGLRKKGPPSVFEDASFKSRFAAMVLIYLCGIGWLTLALLPAK